MANPDSKAAIETHVIKRYVANLERRGVTPKEVKEQHRQITVVFNACHWNRLSDVRPDAFADFLADLSSQGRSARTINKYQAATNQFLQ